MECSLYCQVCSLRFFKVFIFKKHLRSSEHQQKMKDVFPQAAFTYFVMPNVVFMDSQMAHKIDQPVVGLSLITLCFSQMSSMYLCHVCEHSFPRDKILGHVFSPEHCVNYINYTNPNDLSFSWIPNMDMKKILRLKLEQEGVKIHLQTLQMLNLPEQLLERLRTKTYSEVMQTLNENPKLTELVGNFQPKTITVQNYQNDSNRKHPLLGMQHIVECVCVGPSESRHYLCTLCCLPVPTHAIINHIISFDHIHRYFKAWHPNTLLSKESYTNYSSFAPIILDFAKQTEAIHETQHVSMKQVHLQPSEFQSVNFTCYSAALKKLESITKSSLTACVTPGDKLVYNAGVSQPIPISKSSKCKLRCQDCSVIFEGIYPYLQHLSKDQHNRMLIKHFGQDVSEKKYPKVRLRLDLYTYACESLKMHPLVGTDLVVACISSCVDVKPILLCFCCLESFPEPYIKQHFESRKHLVNTLMYQNPWRLPFAWENDLDDYVLKSMAWEEEERRQNKICLKVLDIPYSVFFNLNALDYKQVMKSLQRCHTLLKRQVPPCKTFSKLQQNEKFPLLGKQFMVSHDVSVSKNELVTRFLCLLCEKRLSQDESYAHVFSREHVTTFLDRFHPGSLNPSTDNPETLLDLAEQAAHIHTVSNYQEIKLVRPIWEPCTYEKAIRILTSAKQRDGRGGLVIPIKPKMKLVPRKTQKEEEQRREKDSRKTCLDTGRQENEQIKEQTYDEETQTVKENIQVKEEKRSYEETVKENVQIKEEKVSEVETQTEKKTEVVVKKEVPVNIYPEVETVQPLRVKTEEASTEIKIDEATEICKKMENHEVQVGTKGSPFIRCVTAQKSKVHQKNKNEQVPSERSQKQACSSEDVGEEMVLKRPRSASKDDSSLEQSAKIPKVNLKKEHDDWADVEKWDKNGPTEDFSRISATFFKCCCVNRDPVYLCGSCCQKILENDVFCHLTESQHKKMHRLDVHLDEITYNNIYNQSFPSVIQTLQALKLQRDRDRILSSTSPQSGCRRDNTSEMLQDRCGDDRTVVDMEISDSEGCSATPDPSAATQTAYKTSEVKVHESDHLHAGSVVKVPSAATNLFHKCSENDCDANLSPDTTVRLVKFGIAPKTEDDAEAGLTHSEFKLISAKTTSCSGATISNATRTSKPAAESIQLKSRSGRASEVKPASGTAAQIRCRTLSKGDDGPRCAEETPKASVAPQTNMMTVASAKKVKTIIEHGNPDASGKTAHRRKLVGENADVKGHKKDQPVLHLNTTIPTGSEHKEPRKEPCLSASKAPSGNLKVGTNQLIVVSCENKKQIYCLLCLDKLNVSSQYHLTKFDHQLNYVKMKYPEWTAKESELKSKLIHTVALLAKIEKDLPHTRLAQKLEVKKDVYENLRILSDKKAAERVKEMLGQKASQISSFPVADCLGTSRQEVFSSCEVSSSDDRMLVSFDDQPEQEDRTQDQITWNQMSELESNVKEDITLTYHQNLDERVLEIDDDIQDQSDPEPNQNHGFLAEDVADDAQLEPDANVWCQVEVTPPTERLGLTVPDKEVPRVSAKNQPHQENKKIHQTQQFQITEMEVHLKTEENAPTAQLLEQQSSNGAQIQDQLDPDPILSHPIEKITGKTLSCTEQTLTPETQRRKSESTPQKPSPVQTCSPQLQTAASTGQQNTSGLSREILQAADYGSGPGEHGSLQAQPRILFEERPQGSSNLSHFLNARFGNNNNKPIVGMDLVWECRGIPQKTFYLCELCEENLPHLNICEHMVSLDHQLQFLGKKHPDFLQKFWLLEDLTSEEKKEILNAVVQNLAAREKVNQVDAQYLLLSPEMHRFVQTASFDEALRTVKSFMKGKSSDFSQLVCASQQNTGRKTKKSSLEKKAGVGEDLDVVGERRVLSLEVNPSCLKDEPVVSSVPVVRTNHVPQEAYRGLSPQPNVPKIQNNDSRLQEKSVSESPSPIINTSTICQKPKVSPSKEFPPIRKRAAETPPENLLQSFTSSPLEHPLPIKRTPSPVNVQYEPKPPSASESTSVNSTENPTPPTLKDEDSDPKQIQPTVSRELFAELISMLKERNFKINLTPLMALCHNAESSSSFENVENKDLKPVNINSENAKTTSPQTLQSTSAWDVFRNTRSLSADCAPTNQEQDRIPQSNPELSRFCQQTISTIITTRPNPVKNTFQGGKNVQTHTDVSKEHQVSFHTDSTANLTDSVAVPAGFYAPHSQVVYVTRGDSASSFGQAVAGCTTHNDPHVIAASSCQDYLYPNQTYCDQTGDPFSLQMVRHSSAAQMPPGWENLGLQQLQYYHFWTSGSGKNQ